MPALATRSKATIARPLKVLVPLIREELDAGERAGLEHYRRAGELLLEAKEQIVYGNWKAWVGKNFKSADGRALSYATAVRYMRLATLATKEDGRKITGDFSDYTTAVGDRQPRTQTDASFRAVIDAARDLDADLFGQERQTLDEEVRLHRELAEEWNTIAYRVLAMRLHPDKKGGSKEAMARLNRIRAQFIQFAKTRRFV